MNLLSVGAAYGTVVLFSQAGVGPGWVKSLAAPLGFTRAEAIEAWHPLFLFSVLFGLSMDYQSGWTETGVAGSVPRPLAYSAFSSGVCLAPGTRIQSLLTELADSAKGPCSFTSKLSKPPSKIFRCEDSSPRRPNLPRNALTTSSGLPS